MDVKITRVKVGGKYARLKRKQSNWVVETIDVVDGKITNVHETERDIFPVAENKLFDTCRWTQDVADGTRKDG